MQADAFLFEALVQPGDAVVVERPTYDRTLLNLRNRGAEIHPVDLHEDGIDTDALAGLLEGGVKPALAHVIPNFQNPAGFTLARHKRDRLLELSSSHGFTIFEDDPYVDIRFAGEPLPTMLSLADQSSDGAASVVYACSFSKTVCPGIRVGYLVGDSGLISRIRGIATNTYISPSMVSQGIVNQFCRSGALDRSIATVREALRERAERLGEALRRELPDARFTVPQGGYFMWVELPEGTDVAALFDAAAERDVAFVKGTDFMAEGGENTLRLAYSGVTPDEVDEGVRRLGEAYRAVAVAA
jgi:2-aminoadipate transaminase